MKDERGFSFLPVTSDVAVFNIHAAKFRDDGAFVNVVLIKRKNEPFKDSWALPGGFLNEGESIPECAARELEEETGIKAKMLIPIDTYSNPKRDPRGQVISEAFSVIIPTTDQNALKFEAKDDAAECQLFNLKAHIDQPTNSVKVSLRCVENGAFISYVATFGHGPFGIPQAEIAYDEKSKDKLSFDHAEIIARAITKMPALVTPVAFKSKVEHDVKTPEEKAKEKADKEKAKEIANAVQNTFCGQTN